MRSLALVLVTAASPALAQNVASQTRIPVVIEHGEFGECDGSDTPTFVACVRSVLEAEDAELNRVYASALRSVRSNFGGDQRSESQEESLRKAQRLWVSFKEQDCGDTVAVYDHWGGRWAETMGDICRVVKTRVRKAELRVRYLNP